MWSEAALIAEGDLVIIWETRDIMQPIVVTPGKDINGRFGFYKHADFIGVPYGSKVSSKNGKGYIHLLRPTPELWTLSLPHRTQILYLADIAFITSWLAIRPGSKVIEAGTGSGSFSHSVARTIGVNGRLFTFEFHKQREEKAREEFVQHGIMDRITLEHRNVCKEGFGLEDIADAVFLDLPAPWEAVGHARRALRKDRVSRICCFSPCIEQVTRTVAALNDAGFSDITMYETLIRPVEVSQLPAPIPIEQVAEKLKVAEVKKEERRQKQISRALQDKESRKRRREEAGSDTDALSSTAKRTKADDDVTEVHDDSTSIAAVPTQAHIETLSISVPGSVEAKGSNSKAKTTLLVQKTVVAKGVHETRGHTSYLTFACLRPCVPQAPT